MGPQYYPGFQGHTLYLVSRNIIRLLNYYYLFFTSLDYIFCFMENFCQQINISDTTVSYPYEIFLKSSIIFIISGLLLFGPFIKIHSQPSFTILIVNAMMFISQWNLKLTACYRCTVFLCCWLE